VASKLRIQPGIDSEIMDAIRMTTESAGHVSLRERVRQAVIKTESEIIREALDRHRWNRRKTAEALRISYRSLMYKMKNCNLRDDEQAVQPMES
jgi:two-component system response regulator AtoC